MLALGPAVGNCISVLCFLVLAISGVWEAIGISTWAIKLTNLIIIVTGFVLLLAGGQLRISVTILMTGVLGLAIAIISALRNPLDLTLLSYFQLFSPIIVFGLLMSILSAASQRLLLRILYLFLALQLLAATVKLWAVGVSEGQGVGTLSIQSGSVSSFIVFLFTMIALELHIRGFPKRKIIPLFFAALFFTVVNEKRVGVLIISGMVAVTMIAHRDIKFGRLFSALQKKTTVTRFIPACALVVVILNIGVWFLPSLVEGYSLDTLPSRISSYLLQRDSGGKPLGRLAGSVDIVRGLADQNQLLFGSGPSALLSSNLSIAGSEQYLPDFRATGATILVARAGAVGVFIYLIFFRHLWNRTRHSFAAQLGVVYLLLDFILYSDAIFVSHGIFYIFVIFLLATKNSNQYMKTIKKY